MVYFLQQVFQYLKKGISALIFSNIYISLCAAAQVLLSYKLLHIPIQLHVIIFVTLCTLGMYNFSMILSKPKQTSESPYVKSNWTFNHFTLMYLITLVSFVLSGSIFLFQLRWISKIVMLGTGIISLLYNIPIVKLSGKKVGLRNIPIIKVLLIALVWACSCTILPFLEAGEHQTSLTEMILLSINSFIFVTAITIPFDIRDMYQDTYYHLQTIPILIGAKKSYQLCALLLIIYTVILWCIFPQFNAISMGLSLSTVLTLWVIFNTQLKKNHYYYFFWLDGTLILQYLCVCGCGYFVK